MENWIKLSNEKPYTSILDDQGKIVELVPGKSKYYLGLGRWRGVRVPEFLYLFIGEVSLRLYLLTHGVPWYSRDSSPVDTRPAVE